MDTIQKYKTASGLEVSVDSKELESDNALLSIIESANNRKAGIFSSGFEYPGRHSRWDIAFLDPAIEFSSKNRNFSFNALNQQGAGILQLIFPALEKHSHINKIELEKSSITGELKTPEGFFSEELRSRQASIFSIFREINSILGIKEFPHFGLYGAFGYDLVQQFETLDIKLTRDSEQADCRLFLPLEILVIDRKLENATQYNINLDTPLGNTKNLEAGGKDYLLASGKGNDEVQTDHEDGEFANKVKEVIEGTKKGDYFEVVLSQSFSTKFDSKPSDLFKRLTEINPSPYMFLLNFGTELLVGASPEIYVRVKDRRYETCPIAGTVRRGQSAIEDADQVIALLGSKKEESELTMCTDVDRNDMARVCIPGSVKVIGRRQLEFYSHLIHTVDHLEGTLTNDYDGLDAFQTHMWACTVTGAPKPAAMQTIENLENSPRNWFSGAVGFLSFNGDVNTGITIRFAHIKDGRAQTRAGATLLHGSNPELEEQETRTKSAAFLAALASTKKDTTKNDTAKKDIANNEKNLFNLKIFGKKKKILFVDCKDSFVHNLASYVRQLGAEVITVRAGSSNKAFDINLLDQIKPDLVLLSPGPGTPEEFKIPELVGEICNRKIPAFGVCLGMQGIGQHFGAKLAQLPIPFHGKSSLIKHNKNKIFDKLPSEFEAGRYHSLYLEAVPKCLEVIASCEFEGKEIPMAIKHKELPIAAVQFHPESLMTLKDFAGHLILKNAIETLCS